MKSILFRATLFLNVLVVFFLFNATLFAQNPPVRLALDNSLELETKGGEEQVFSVSLGAGQTARVEIVQNGVDVCLAAVDPQQKIFIETLSPSGYYGEDLILVTAGLAGEYEVRVSTADPRAKPGKYTIILKEIRRTVPEDLKINEAAAKINESAEAATILNYKETLTARREKIPRYRSPFYWSAFTLLGEWR